MEGNAQSKPFVGWPLLPVPDAQGQLHYPDVATSVRQGIEVILRTRPGEQLLRPRFGGGLESYLHEPDNEATRQAIRDLIETSLERWESRIVLDRVEVWDAPGPGARIRVELGYRLVRTGEPGQVSFSMDLEA